MKKTILLFVAVVGFALMSNNLSAQTKATTEKAVVKTEQTVATPGKFVDKNKDGICDNHQAKVKNGKGAKFVDKNGDGVCDNHHAKKGKKHAKCNGKGKGHGHGKCCGHHKGNKHGNCHKHGQNR